MAAADATEKSMLNPSLAPVRRAVFFFGFMALGVAALSAGPAFQPVTDQSSTTVAQARGTVAPVVAPAVALRSLAQPSGVLEARLTADGVNPIR